VSILLFFVSKQVQQYYHHSHNPTPPVMLVNAYFADGVAVQHGTVFAMQESCQVYVAMQHYVAVQQ
jgi:hypothetical protein